MPVLVKGSDAPRLRREYSELHHYNPKLCDILLKLQHFVETNFHKNVTITQIERSQEENDRIYKSDKTKMHRKTAHGVWAAVDIRSSDFNETQISEMLAFLNAYNSSNSNPIKGGNTGLYHAVAGGAAHIHIQYAPPLKHKAAGV
ncbi:hypothetical protein MTR72_16545 [Bradyrhizobium sp. ISRA442]|uniref:hypothetical protein n=1 Tax=Bradyrhizobium sp. ISRA442 TaxID=2866197 RepID=UPI00311ACC4B